MSSLTLLTCIAVQGVTLKSLGKFCHCKINSKSRKTQSRILVTIINKKVKTWGCIVT
jgi:hypothetical protein